MFGELNTDRNVHIYMVYTYMCYNSVLQLVLLLVRTSTPE